MCSNTYMWLLYFVPYSAGIHIISLFLVTRTQPGGGAMDDLINIYHMQQGSLVILAAELKPVLKGAMSKNGVLGPFMPAKNCII
jgi:hypothetical protein